MTNETIKEWRKKMAQLGLPSTASSYYMFMNICPACIDKQDAKCSFCDNTRTYVTYCGNLERKNIQQFQEAVRRALELYQEIGEEEKRYKELEYRYDQLQKRLTNIEGIVSKMVVSSNAELEKLTAALEKVVSMRRYKVTVGKVQAWLAIAVQAFHQEKTHD